MQSAGVQTAGKVWDEDYLLRVDDENGYIRKPRLSLRGWPIRK
jgi:hypothetical protein